MASSLASHSYLPIVSCLNELRGNTAVITHFDDDLPIAALAIQARRREVINARKKRRRAVAKAFKPPKCMPEFLFVGERICQYLRNHEVLQFAVASKFCATTLHISVPVAVPPIRFPEWRRFGARWNTEY